LRLRSPGSSLAPLFADVLAQTGLTVDPRHVALLADVMSYKG